MDDLVLRKELVNLSGEAKLDLIIQLSEDASINAADLTERARSYASQNLNPVFTMLQRSFHGRQGDFPAIMEKIQLSSFKIR